MTYLQSTIIELSRHFEAQRYAVANSRAIPEISEHFDLFLEEAQRRRDHGDFSDCCERDTPPPLPDGVPETSHHLTCSVTIDDFYPPEPSASPLFETFIDNSSTLRTIQAIAGSHHSASGDYLRYNLYKRGMWMEAHSHADQSPGGVAAVYYLTDDYEGGELALQTKSGNDFIYLKPQKGSLVIFSSELKHFVCPVRSGEKIVCGTLYGPRVFRNFRA